MKTVHTTVSCDYVGCNTLVDLEDEYSSVPNDWVTVAGMMDVFPFVHDHPSSKMFCSWAHAAEWVTERAKRVAQQR